MTVTEAIRARTSIRAFTPEPVPEDVVRTLLDIARYAPSGGNLQPWRTILVAGEARAAVIARVRERMSADPAASEEGAHPIYPAGLWSPFRERRFKVGEDMYALLGIGREDKFARIANLARNYSFFDAPVGLFFVIDRRMGHGQWAHMGMFMQSLALAAHEHGYGTCMQEAWARYRDTLGTHFGLGPEEMIYCGMALGRPDREARVNALRSDRAPVDEIATFMGFEP
jgi:nitroreductase